MRPTQTQIVHLLFASRHVQAYSVWPITRKLTPQSTSPKTSSGFLVLEPKQDTYHFESSPTLVTWLTAETQDAPINCPEVDILFANDGGVNFSSFTPLLENTPNDGSQSVTLPSGTSSTGRILIQCSDNIFYNINNGSFNIIDSNLGLLTVSTDLTSITEGNSNNTSIIFTITRTGDLNTTSSVNYSLNGFGTNPTKQSGLCKQPSTNWDN